MAIAATRKSLLKLAAPSVRKNRTGPILGALLTEPTDNSLYESLGSHNDGTRPQGGRSSCLPQTQILIVRPTGQQTKVMPQCCALTYL
uniref:Uncharacterized protein n=1 Tax=Ascaris lumbricoides TaxID=6252 RepID=A0A0M3HPQ8_ASCLU